ncbi:MAG: Flp family type IVb pilin [Bacillota bacterium]
MLKAIKGAARTVTGIHKDEKGQGMAEYGLIIALVAVVVMAAIGIMGQRLLAKLNKVNEQLQ